jgi:hypothetical protein
MAFVRNSTPPRQSYAPQAPLSIPVRKSSFLSVDLVQDLLLRLRLHPRLNRVYSVTIPMRSVRRTALILQIQNVILFSSISRQAAVINRRANVPALRHPHRSPVLQDILVAATNCNRFHRVVTCSACRILLSRVGVDQQAKPVPVIPSVAAAWSALMDFAAIRKLDQGVLC